jgi:uncharacterized membrane protein YjdF
MVTDHRREKADRIITIFVFASLMLSVIYSIVGMIRATAGAVPIQPNGRLKSDYTLMLVQCLLGIVVMFLPSLLEKRRKFVITDQMHMLFMLFLYCAIYLGEVRNFYNKVPNWDTILHTFSGAMLGALGFSLIDNLNDSKSVRIQLSDKFVAVFSFCFALSLGTIWEIYEFTGDRLLSLNMQRFMLEDGTPLVGALALQDTMKDLIVDALGALILIVYGYYTKNKKHTNNKKQK